MISLDEVTLELDGRQSNMIDVPIRRQSWEDKTMEDTVLVVADGSDATTNQRAPRLLENHEKPGRGKEGLSYVFLRERGPCWYLDSRLLASRTLRQ